MSKRLWNGNVNEWSLNDLKMDTGKWKWILDVAEYHPLDQTNWLGLWLPVKPSTICILRHRFYYSACKAPITLNEISFFYCVLKMSTNMTITCYFRRKPICKVPTASEPRSCQVLTTSNTFDFLSCTWSLVHYTQWDRTMFSLCPVRLLHDLNMPLAWFRLL